MFTPPHSLSSSSSSSTLVPPNSPPLKLSKDVEEGPFFNPHIPASLIVEYIASRSTVTSTVYIYDVAEQVGFGTLTKEWAKSDHSSAATVDLQTRAGAGLGLVGRLSEGTSYETSKGALLTAYTTPCGLATMTPSLSYLPPASAKSRLVIQVPIATPTGKDFALSTTLAPMATAWRNLQDNTIVLISSTPQQTVDFAHISYHLHNYHVVHLFDHQGSAREVGHLIRPPPETDLKGSTITDILGRSGYSFFDYAGDAEANTLIILLNGPLALAAMAFAKQVTGLAVIAVNVLRPWNSEVLRAQVPKTVTEIHVFEDVSNVATQGTLYVDTFEALYEEKSSLSIHSHRFTPTRTLQFLTEENAFSLFLMQFAPVTRPEMSLFPDNKKLFFFNAPQSSLSPVAYTIRDLFTVNKNVSARLLTDHDIISSSTGVSASRLLVSSRNVTSTFVPLNIMLPYGESSDGQADFVGVLDQNLLKNLSLLRYAKRNSSILLVTSWTPEELVSNIPPEVTAFTRAKDLRVYSINANYLASKWPALQSVMAQKIVSFATLRLYLGPAATQDSIFKIAQIHAGKSMEGVSLSELCEVAWSGLVEVDLTQNTLTTTDQSASAGLKTFQFNAISMNLDDTETVVNGARIGSWHEAAKHLLFPSIFTPAFIPSQEEHPPNPSLRPEVLDRTYLVTCTVNRRLTPIEYDRNVFHLEFDTTGTGLKYSIGEALGIHGWNDEQEVLDFCAWYDVDPERLVTIPVVSGEGQMHTRTVFQALQQQIDIFGKPPKSFYTDLANFATNVIDKYTLQFIGSPEGSATFKKLSEKDTVTFADVLKKYPSARPGIERLCELVGDIKPRHYSIASSQAVVGNRVDLLVVTVHWETPEGVLRYGQCTKYLAGLKVGQKVTVSIKPSVMKLPADPRQPLIMAGLGTGAAPFRAFLQYLAWCHERGEEIGPVYYYFGSRHQASEYLYGEEIESFVLDGVITRAGLAFSRDQPKKVYIQHKMLEDSEVLAKMLHKDQGVFYLCGPTWPVPDVYEALVNALSKYSGTTIEVAGQYLENLKEEERYVLEVY